MPEADLDLLISAAREAGALALDHFDGPRTATEKPDNQGPVTEADLAVNALLHERLRTARPDYGWLSEESEDDPARRSARHVFVIDPIDGTRSFVAGDKVWAHSLAVVSDGVVTAGVVFLPALNRLYAAARGKGASCNGVRIQASPRAELTDARILTHKALLSPERWRGTMPQMRRHFRPSLAYRLCLVGSGAFDAMIGLRDTWEWDTAAGDLIAREAGAVVTTREGARLHYNQPVPKNDGLIAAAPQLHPQIRTQFILV